MVASFVSAITGYHPVSHMVRQTFLVQDRINGILDLLFGPAHRCTNFSNLVIQYVATLMI